MYGINERIAELLENNRDLFEGRPIAFDGVVDEQRYLKSEIKTLFLLKEVNDDKMVEDWDGFMEDVKAQTTKDSLYTTWPNVCLWMEALKNKDVTYMDCMDGYGTFDTQRMRENLLDIALVNIKKTAGRGSSNADEIDYAVNKYGHIICEEVERIIKPDLVLCGGTFEYAKNIFNPDKIKVLRCGAEYFIKNDRLFVRFPHPVWFSVNRNILFAYAKTIFAEVRELFCV